MPESLGVEHQLGRLSAQIGEVKEQVRAGREDHLRDKHDILSALREAREQLEGKIDRLHERVNAIELARAHDDGVIDGREHHTAAAHEGHLRWSGWVAAAGIIAGSLVALLAWLRS